MLKISQGNQSATASRRGTNMSQWAKSWRWRPE